MLGEDCTIDFHTHYDFQTPLPAADGVWRIVSLPLRQAHLPLPANTLTTLELHPWSGEQWSSKFADMAAEARFIGIGEVGLDRLKGRLTIPEQLAVLEQAVKRAEELQKPLTVHCVKAFSELLALYKRLRWQVPTIIHYFRGNLALARQLWDHTQFVLSLPPAAYTQTALWDFLRDHPTYQRRVVLETDDPQHGDIQAHYRTAAGLLQKPLPELRQLMRQQLERIYHAGNF